jgi:UDP-N-acetylmuramate dehydrogenase
MIEELGLKGYQLGGAQISDKHAGFIVNQGGATAADVLALIAFVQAQAKAKWGVDLQPEVHIVGED